MAGNIQDQPQIKPNLSHHIMLYVAFFLFSHQVCCCLSFPHPVLHVEVQSDDSITSNAVQTNQASWSAAVMCGSLSFLYWMFRALGHLNLSSFLVCIYTENVSWIKFQAFAIKLDKPICLK